MNRDKLFDCYEVLREKLIEARKETGLMQADVAKRLRKPQSFVSKYERGERRLDLVEFILVCRALRINARKMFLQIEMNMPLRKHL